MKKWLILHFVFVVFTILSLTGCESPAGGGGGGGGTRVINIAAIGGLTAPAVGGTPVIAITPTAQYTGTVVWSPIHNLFQNSTVYFATITLTPKKGYTLEGVPTDFFTVMGANKVNNDADSGVITVIFPRTAGTIDNPAVIDIPIINGIAPVIGETPKTAITPTAQYTGTITWSPDDNRFKRDTVYTATINLVPKAGFTFTGVAADFFTVTGANTVNNEVNSKVVMTVFSTYRVDFIVEEPFTNIDDLRSYLLNHGRYYPNGINYIVKLNVADITDIGTALSNVNITETTAYVYLDLSGSTMTTIPEHAFNSKYTLSGITIPNSVTSIGDGAFMWCTSLTSVTIPDSVTSIGGSAFYQCTSLTSVTIPNSVTSIDYYAFGNCTNLNITWYYNPAAYFRDFNDIHNYLKTVIIPNSVTSIEDYAFYNCFNLTSITIPDSVISIGDYAFYECQRLTNITIPNSVTSIGNNAFNNCTSLTSITIGNSVTSIGNVSVIFYGCTSLTAINVDSGNTNYSSDQGVLYNKSKTYLFRYPEGKTGGSFSIPNSVTWIDSYAFYGCTSLTAINVDSGNTNYSSDQGVLYNKSKTDLIQYPAGKTGGSFSIPNSVTSIEGEAFSHCGSLTSITIPEGVTNIGYSAFQGCTNLTSVTFQGTISSDNFGYFDNNHNREYRVFDGDLVEKYLAGGKGTYTRVIGGEKWTKM